MALDYSKLSDDELEALANDDYSKLSDATLKALAADTGTNAAPPQAAEYVAAQVPTVAAGAARELMGGAATANIRDAATIARNATAWTPNAIMEVVSHPVQTAQAYVAGHPWANTPVSQLAKGVGRNVVGAVAQGAIAPENLFTLPYTMAAYEQEKIRANPNAPGLEYNPYAQTVRGEYPTQGAAGAANTRAAIRNMNTAGNPAPGTPQFAQMQQQYQQQAQQPSWIDNAMQTFKRYRQVIGQ